MAYLITKDEYNESHSSYQYLDDIFKVIDAEIDRFSSRIVRNNNLWMKSNYQSGSYKSVFSSLGIGNADYFEFEHHERYMEWCIRENLLNNILMWLFKNKGYEVYRISEKNLAERIGCSLPSVCQFDNRLYEEKIPFEFIVKGNQMHIGYRYFPWYVPQEAIVSIMSQYHLNKIVVISCDGSMIHKRSDSQIDNKSLHDLFVELASEEVYEYYSKKVISAVGDANIQIGFQAIPQLSDSNVRLLKKKISCELCSFDFGNLQYQSSSAEFKTNFDSSCIEVIKNNVVSKEYYKALVGNEDFAQSFLTSEYLYRNYHYASSFDYTSIIVGYFKSVEQLVFAYLNAALSSGKYSNLFIKKHGHVPNIDNLSTDRKMVRFKKENIEYFDTTIKSMLDFLNNIPDNVYLPSIKDTANSILHDYATDYRNRFLHKTNLLNREQVETIRNNTYFCLLLLLGVYKLTDSKEDDYRLYGIVDDSYERFYEKLSSLSVSKKCFYIDDGNGEMRVYRPEVQDPPKYDWKGNILSNIRFCKDDEKGEEIIVNRNNIPLSIAYEGPKGKEYLKW